MVDVKLTSDPNKITDERDTIFDSSWMKTTFIISDTDIVTGDEYSKWVRKNRYFSTADLKFTSTSPGMNMSVNPKPQFTRYADPRVAGKIKSRPKVTVGTTTHTAGLGQGRYYSEAIDDNQQRIYLRFGVAKYMPLPFWIYKSFNIDRVILQNRGVITSSLLTGIGLVAKFYAFAAAPLLALGMYAMNVVVQSSRFYSVKDTMYVYWCTVENILNSMTVRRTMVPQTAKAWTFKTDNTMGREQKVTQNFLNSMNSMIPDLVDKETGRISVFAIALRAQAAFNKMKHDDYLKTKDKTATDDWTGYQETGATSHDTYLENKKGNTSFFTKYLFDTAYNLLIKDNAEQQIDTEDKEKASKATIIDFDTTYLQSDGTPIDTKEDPNNPKDSIEQRVIDSAKAKKSKLDKYGEYMMAELSEGGAFAVFSVDNSGSVGESFSNSFGANPMESMFNSLSAKSRNISDFLSSATSIPVVGDAMKLAADAGAKILSEASFGIANPLLALAYGVNITAPKVWESSSSTLPRASYKLKLISPYGNAYSQLFNIYLPMAMIMAGALPRSTGRSSYTSPFFCQLFDRGHVNISLGCIENVSFTRGTSNLAFSKNGHPNAIDVDISIANLDEVVSVDVSDSGVIGKALQLLDPDYSDTPFTTYINTVTAVDVYTQIYMIPNVRLKFAERYAQFKAAVNPDPAAYAAMTVNTVPGLGLAKAVLGDNTAAMQDLINR